MARKNQKKQTKRKSKKLAISRYPFPATKVAKLKYVQEVSIDINDPGLLTNGIGIHTFRANGCYDPDYALGVGQHQPRGWNQFEALYNEYVVLGSKITFQPFPVSSTGITYSQPRYYGLVKRNEQNDPLSATKSIGDIMETRLGQYARMPSARTNMPRSLSTTFSHKKTFKTNPHESLKQVTVDPTHQDSVLYDCYIIPNADADQDEPPTSCLITIEYIVMFSNPKILTKST